MQQVALIADIHSNYEALKEVLADINIREIEHIYCLGDLVGYGPRPNEVVEELLKSRKIPTVLGNYDDGVAFDRLVCGCDYKSEEEQRLGVASLSWTKKELQTESRNFLQSLPQEIKTNISSFNFLLFHGSPRALNEYLFADTSEETFLEISAEHQASVYCFGHTHFPFHKTLGKRHFINAGSVGRPKDGDPRACYTILNLNEKEVRAEFIRVPYDVNKVAEEIVQVGLPEEFASFLKKGGK